MSDVDSRCEKCERNIEQLRAEFEALRSEMIEIAREVLARADEVLAKVDTYNRQMYADLRAQTEAGQTEAGFASLRASLDARALPLSDHKDEPPTLN
jgi:hypothetical protein